ncbi:terpenoid synthase [Epithele typhae]|uniref:terpenoid synthase n=1 Tax=Epithele typhae TaxID=378194 RepID=UPI0020077861|nr:terpenoid synthase [Epithele typhae]KAH9932678.1 terpenoid synthase [Epithele typhae]
MLAKMLETACSYAETAYAHLAPAHRHYVALYTACVLYAEDLGARDPAAVAHFARRLIAGAPQLSPVFDRLAALLRGAHALWTDAGADAIIASTLDALSATALEHAAGARGGMAVAPDATRWPYYLRTRAGGGPQYTHFMFMRGWRESPESYLQILPLSFYKEELVGERTNYVHLRAAAEQITPMEVLQRLTAEVLDTAERIERVVGDDLELRDLWHQYKQTYLEFTIRTPRYRMKELGVVP